MRLRNYSANVRNCTPGPRSNRVSSGHLSDGRVTNFLVAPPVSVAGLPAANTTRFSISMDFTHRVGFAVGTGRCGTLFLHQAAAGEPAVAASHERNPDNESFHRYCQWHRLPVDDEGFLATKEREIAEDLAQRAFSFEASPYLSLSVRQLYQRFAARFVLLVRRPDSVVTSFAHKGFYRKPYRVGDPELAAGYQDQGPERIFTFFARVSPRGPAFRSWNDMTQVGKIAWFWRAYNERTIELLHGLPAESYRIVRIEDLDYAGYLDLARFLGYDPKLSEGDFDALRESRPHAFWRKRNIDQWTEQEIAQYESQVGELSERFGYRWRIAELADEARAQGEESRRLGRIPPPKAPARLWRVRRATAQLLRGVAKSVDVG